MTLSNPHPASVRVFIGDGPPVLSVRPGRDAPGRWSAITGLFESGVNARRANAHDVE
ncbi:hypothetical protein MASSI9I_10193 [Massilia sp. 9I]|nr:hypothetical protein MASSI9I_10193 [Massilia sp. 9I]